MKAAQAIEVKRIIDDAVARGELQRFLCSRDEEVVITLDGREVRLEKRDVRTSEGRDR